MRKLPSTRTSFFFILFSPLSRTKPSTTSIEVYGRKRMQIAGWRSYLQTSRARLHTSGRDSRERKKERRRRRRSRRREKRERERTGLWTAARPILITRHVYRDPETSMLPRTGPAFLFLPDTNAFYYVRTASAKEKGGPRGSHPRESRGAGK